MHIKTVIKALLLLVVTAGQAAAQESLRLSESDSAHFNPAVTAGQDLVKQDPSQFTGNGVVDFIPFLWRDTKARGFHPPKPFFISPVFYFMETYYDVSDATASAEINGVTEIIDDIRIASQKSQMLSFGVRAGANIFPFMNVYGLYMHTEGKSKSKTYLRDRTLYDLGFNSMQNGAYKVDTETDFTAETGAVGATLTYGIPDLLYSWGVFGTFNANMAWSKASMLEEIKNTVVASARFGVTRDIGLSKRFAVWAGVEYMKMLGDSEWSEGTQSFTVPHGDPGVTQALWGETYESKFRAKSIPNSPWSMTAGLNFSPSRYVDFVVEAGFLSKLSIMTAASINF